MQFTDVLYIAVLLFSVMLSIITTIMARKAKSKENCETSIENRTESSDGNSKDQKVKNFWEELLTKLPDYIVSAEQFYNQIVGKSSGVKTGVQKLAQVLDKVKIDCLTAGVEYDEQKATEMVNGLIDMTNKVNTNK